MPLYTPLERLFLVLEAALAHYDNTSSTEPGAHPSDCDCGACGFVADIRNAVDDWNAVKLREQREAKAP